MTENPIDIYFNVFYLHLMKQMYVYIMTNKNNTTLYVGVTNDLVRRVWEHKNKVHKKSFTARYNLEKLVYYEIYEDELTAIEREKKLKGGNRLHKNELIESVNPEWNDLYNSIC